MIFFLFPFFVFVYFIGFNVANLFPLLFGPMRLHSLENDNEYSRNNLPFSIMMTIKLILRNYKFFLLAFVVVADLLVFGDRALFGYYKWWFWTYEIFVYNYFFSKEKILWFFLLWIYNLYQFLFLNYICSVNFEFLFC